ncbi:DUF2490 domain-containing protein [Pedobacter aquae]|uniref:DUF2490 domain-containing protein n=1 Tax=Pedobacter aquae TaxID=2605747 RepID=A0A5C0VHZ8_9SPHI|nr:DUF2490 domain-containing protein [Pedobacter aquae]QEK52106.1 DUF2490 domain-containing protein [Pedobacter aquae]
MKKHILLFLAATTLSLAATAQTVNQQSGWAAWFHSQKFSKKTGLHFDFQVRSADDLAYVRNILIRPGFTYFINDKLNATVGYALIISDQPGADALTESRIWEQFVVTYKLGKIPLTHRFRLEQRFINQANGDDAFSQRLRYFFRSVIPLQKQSTPAFSKGAFVALQNEVFLSIQNQPNGHLFDQNRLYLAAGYRLNPKMDLEAGYLNQSIKGAVVNTNNNIFQVALYTRF